MPNIISLSLSLLLIDSEIVILHKNLPLFSLCKEKDDYQGKIMEARISSSFHLNSNLDLLKWQCI